MKDSKKGWDEFSTTQKVVVIAGCVLLAILVLSLIPPVRKALGYILVFVLICFVVDAPNIEARLERRILGTSASCYGCIGCDAIYDLVTQIVLQAARHGDIVGIRPPRAPSDVQTVCTVPPSGHTCFQFVLLHDDSSQKHSIEAVQAFLARRILDATQANAQHFYGTPVQGLYLDAVIETDAYTYTIQIVPVCPFNAQYFEYRKQQADYLRKSSKASTEVEEVYDDELQKPSR